MKLPSIQLDAWFSCMDGKDNAKCNVLYNTMQYKKFVTRTMSVIWQNPRREQLVVADGKSEVKK